MSMSEFERQMNTWDRDFSTLSTQGHDLPADFSDDDVAFAEELDELFALHKEDIPPYYVQTLLDSEEPLFQPVEQGFELKTRVRVFRRLKLRYRLFQKGRPSFRSIVGGIPAQRSLSAGAAFILVVFLTVMFTGASFASGIAMLLHNAKAGVLLVQDYPTALSRVPFPATLQSDADAQQKMSLFDAQQHLHSWRMYWPQLLPDNYRLTDSYLYQEPQQSWADGPFIEFDYTLNSKNPHGTGELAIREFKLNPNVKVLQVVKDGSTTAIKTDQNGLSQAIYVDGQWILHSKFPIWVKGQRSELIYQKDGIVFWIVGDQRDGVNQNTLLKVANSLQALHLIHAIPLGNKYTINTVSLLDGDVNGPFTGDVLAISPDGSEIGTYLSLVGSQQYAPIRSIAVHSR
ncbi:MAG: hypothetical protein M3Y76_12550 [Chloroflexota bacterium]|nr:hypothetical protein [Chloroflexota bacterium]